MKMLMLLMYVFVAQPDRFQSIHQFSLEQYWEGVRVRNDSLVFRYALDATDVAVVGDFNGWDIEKGKMERDSVGLFYRAFRVKPGVYRYRLIVDGRPQIDPTTMLKISCPFRWFSAVKVKDGMVSFKFSRFEKILMCIKP